MAQNGNRIPERPREELKQAVLRVKDERTSISFLNSPGRQFPDEQWEGIFAVHIPEERDGHDWATCFRNGKGKRSDKNWRHKPILVPDT
jgi:hypothetical protein